MGIPTGTYDFDINFPDVFYTFTGQEEDDELGLYNFKARLYDPVLGRFISPDAIVPNPENPQSLNRYSYCLNNPLRYIDPKGNQETDPNDPNNNNGTDTGWGGNFNSNDSNTNPNNPDESEDNIVIAQAPIEPEDVVFDLSKGWRPRSTTPEQDEAKAIQKAQEEAQRKALAEEVRHEIVKIGLLMAIKGIIRGWASEAITIAVEIVDFFFNPRNMDGKKGESQEGASR